MAPEQMKHPLTFEHRADIYSLGVTLYEMLTGELPLGRFAPPSQKVQIDVRLDEVVLRALEREPGGRYQRASEVKTEVEALGGAAGGAASPAGLEARVLAALRESKVLAIRLYREGTGAGLAQAREAVEDLARRHGVQPGRGGGNAPLWL